MGRIALLAPQHEGVPTPAALELASLAASLSPDVEAYAFGPGAGDTAAALGAHGVARLAVIDLADEHVLPEPVVAATTAAEFAADPPEAVLLASSYEGRDTAARLSALLDLPVLSNATHLEREGDDLVAEHELFGGSQRLWARFSGSATGIFLVRAHAAEALDHGGPPAAVRHLGEADPGPAGRVRVLERRRADAAGPALEDASVVVSGGRGIATPENYALIERLATLLHGAAGASRAVVDAGWAPYSRQVGQTGKTISPELYLACGISGATQHLVGMNRARHVVAINSDPSAPIFSLAELAVVADLRELLPRLIAALEAREGG